MAVFRLMMIVVLAAIPALAQQDPFWEFESRPDPTPVIEGPEIRDPFFEVCIALIQGDSLGVWSGDELAARIAATGRETKLPIELVDRVERIELPFAEWHHRRTSHARRIVRMVMLEDIDLPLPYSILGYNPGSLYVSRQVDFLEWDLGEPRLRYNHDGKMVILECDPLTALELVDGWVVLDVDGWLDRLLGKKLDDTWMEAFVIGRVWGSGKPEEDGLQGLALGRSRKGRPLTGSFDFRHDKVLPNGRDLATAVATVARPVASPVQEREDSRAWEWPRGR